MEYEKIIHSYITEHKEEIINTLKELVKIPSVKSTAEKNAPFGKKCADILEYIKMLYTKNGFDSELDSEGGYLLSYYKGSSKALGLFSHADVVGVNNDWVYTSPFEPIEKDGYLIGRGTLDDKSAVVISLYCAKMIKELNIPFKSTLVMFSGSAEETGMSDIDMYKKKHTEPDFSLVCDTAFPLYRGNKSNMNCKITFNSALSDIEAFYGGTAANITLGKAQATLKGEHFSEEGISRHSALPEGSVNAAFLLAKSLYEHPKVCDSDKTQMKLLMKMLEAYHGEAFGIEHTDKDFGKLTCTNGIISTENGKLSLVFNIRFGLSADIEKIKSNMRKFCENNNCSIEFEKEKKGYIIPETDKYVKACLEAYSDFTGNKNPKTYVNAGGTYARKLSRAAEIGTTLVYGTPKNTPKGHGGVHQPDECISLDGFLKATELTLHMLLSCDKINN